MNSRDNFPPPVHDPFPVFLYHDDVPEGGDEATTESEGPFTFSNLSLADDIAILINLSRQAFSHPLPSSLPPSHSRQGLHVHTPRFIGRDKIRSRWKVPRIPSSFLREPVEHRQLCLRNNRPWIICHSWKSNPPFQHYPLSSLSIPPLKIILSLRSTNRRCLQSIYIYIYFQYFNKNPISKSRAEFNTTRLVSISPSLLASRIEREGRARINVGALSGACISPFIAMHVHGEPRVPHGLYQQPERKIRSGTGGGKFLAPTRLRVWPWTDKRAEDREGEGGLELGMHARSIVPSGIGTGNRDVRMDRGDWKLGRADVRKIIENLLESTRDSRRRGGTSYGVILLLSLRHATAAWWKGKKGRKKEEEERGGGRKKRNLCFVPRRWRMQSAFLPVVYVSRTNWPNAFSNYIPPSPPKYCILSITGL